MRFLFLTALTVCLSGCGDESTGSVPEMDASVVDALTSIEGSNVDAEPDVGVVMPDAEVVEPDAFTPEPDAEVDAFEPDAFIPEPDANPLTCEIGEEEVCTCQDPTLIPSNVTRECFVNQWGPWHGGDNDCRCSEPQVRIELTWESVNDTLDMNLRLENPGLCDWTRGCTPDHPYDDWRHHDRGYARLVIQDHEGPGPEVIILDEANDPDTLYRIGVNVVDPLEEPLMESTAHVAIYIGGVLAYDLEQDFITRMDIPRLNEHFWYVGDLWYLGDDEFNLEPTTGTFRTMPNCGEGY